MSKYASQLQLVLRRLLQLKDVRVCYRIRFASQENIQCRKTYLGVFKKIETMHIHSESIDVLRHKRWDVNLFCRSLYKNNKFQVHLHWKTNSQEFCLVVHMHLKFIIFVWLFSRLSLQLNFCVEVHLQILYGCVSFQIVWKLLSLFF